MSKQGPRGWKPNEIITSRIDGWLVDPDNPERIPDRVARAIARAMPGIGDGSSVADIRVRMIARMRAAGLSYD